MRKVVFSTLLICAALWGASQWWEKGLAQPSGSAHISPNGCYRVQQFKPFWVLPSAFHPQAHPDETAEVHLFVRWESPAFFRLYDQRNGRLISESAIYDLVSDGGPLFWGMEGIASVSAGMIEIGPIRLDCAL